MISDKVAVWDKFWKEQRERTMNTIPIPELLKDRPLFHGYLIPYTTFIDKGVPDFKVMDEKRIIECLYDELCAMCGKSLKVFNGKIGWVAFIGGEMSLKNNIYRDPGMHVDCAYYATKVCPYLSDDKARHVEFVKNYGPEIKIKIDPHASAVRPKKMVMNITKGYDVVQIGNTLYAQPYKRGRKLDWNAMP